MFVFFAEKNDCLVGKFGMCPVLCMGFSTIYLSNILDRLPYLCA